MKAQRHNECTWLQSYQECLPQKILRSHSSPVSKLFQGMTALQLYRLKTTLFSQIPN